MYTSTLLFKRFKKLSYRIVKMNPEQNVSKPKKVMTAEMLQNLQLAREKARLKRKEQGELSRLKKELEEKTKAEQIQELKAKLGKEKAPEPETDEEEEPQPQIKKKKKTKKPIVIVEESESDSEDEQVVYIKRKSNKPKAPVVLQEEPLIPDDPPPAPQPVFQSPYHGLHPSMLQRRRF
jgi:hypothetical protein